MASPGNQHCANCIGTLGHLQSLVDELFVAVLAGGGSLVTFVLRVIRQMAPL